MLKSRRTKSILVLAPGALVVLIAIIRMFDLFGLNNLLALFAEVAIVLALLFRAKGRTNQAVIFAVACAGLVTAGKLLEPLLSGDSVLPVSLVLILVDLPFQAILILYAINVGRAEHRWLWLILAVVPKVAFHFLSCGIGLVYHVPLARFLSPLIILLELPQWALIALGFWPLRPDCDAVSGTPTASRGA